jgi:hypothetical protein
MYSATVTATAPMGALKGTHRPLQQSNGLTSADVDHRRHRDSCRVMGSADKAEDDPGESGGRDEQCGQFGDETPCPPDCGDESGEA